MKHGKALLGGLVFLSLTLLPLAGPDHFHEGTPDLKTAGALAFSPDGVLFVGDSQGAAVFAFDTRSDPAASGGEYQIEGIDRQVASLLGTTTERILINDLAVHPVSRRVYISLSRGLGADAAPVIVTVDGSGQISDFDLRQSRFMKVDLDNAPAADATDRRGRSLRTESITDLAFHEGQILVAGLSNEEFASSLRQIPYPFDKQIKSSSVEIFHVAHGQYETHSPIRAFVPIDLGGQPHILASYTCTPLVAFPFSSFRHGEHVKGRTVAELGSGNRPLDMVSMERDGKTYILMSNSNRTLMRIDAAEIVNAPSLTQPATERYQTVGVNYVAIPRIGVLQLDNLDKERVVVIERSVSDGSLNLRSYPKSRM